MTALIGGLLSVCAFGSITMAINAFIDFTNKDIKLNKKDKGKGVVNDEIESFREEHGRVHKVR